MPSARNVKIAKWLLRFGLAFVYAYAAFEIFLHPDNFLKYVPLEMQNLIPINVFLILFSILEVGLVLWFLSGKHTEYAGILSFLLMIGIIAPNLEYFNVLFRNVAIAFSSLVLFVLEYEKDRHIFGSRRS